MEQVQTILYQCERCNKRFPCKPSLDRHEITHDLEEVASWVISQSEIKNTSSNLEQSTRDKLEQTDINSFEQTNRHGLEQTAKQSVEQTARESLEQSANKTSNQTSENNDMDNSEQTDRNSSDQIALHIPPHKKLVTEANGTENISDDEKRMTSIQQEYMLQESTQPYVKSASIKTKAAERGNDLHDSDHDDELETENEKMESDNTPTKSTPKNGKKGPRGSATQTPKEKVYACDECSRWYTRRDHLNRHKLSHTGERPYVCSVCLKSFIRKDKLQRHERIHSGEKSCSCSVCGKIFSRKDLRAKHLKVHEDGYVPPVKKAKMPQKKVRQPIFIVKEKAEKQASVVEEDNDIKIEESIKPVKEEPYPDLE